MQTLRIITTLIATFSIWFYVVNAQNDVPTPYNYQYNVENPPTNTFFGKSEAGDTTGRVTGSYYVWLPDGRLMTVEYYDDGQSGFVPKISYQNNANPVQG